MAWGITIKSIHSFVLIVFIIQNAASLRIHSAQGHNLENSVGGYTILDVNKLTDDAIRVDSYLRVQHPELSNATLESV